MNVANHKKYLLNKFRGNIPRRISPHYNFEDAKTQWSYPPIDGIGYLSTKKMAEEMNDEEIREVIDNMSYERYTTDIIPNNLCRNIDNKWRKYLGLDTTTDSVVMDFGCGCGIEGLQFAKTNNKVILADITSSNLKYAARVFNVYGYKPLELCLVYENYPFVVSSTQKIDIFHSVGVLHHTPNFRPILERASEILSPDGEIRLLLYSDVAWTRVCGEPLPLIEEKVINSLKFEQYTKHYDGKGCYADWYNADKIEYTVGDFLKLDSFDYVTKVDAYCVAVLKKR